MMGNFLFFFKNPAPGLQVFQPDIPFAETDSDFHLCPLPRYTSNDTTNPHASTQKQYLDREVSDEAGVNRALVASQSIHQSDGDDYSILETLYVINMISDEQ